MKLVTTAVIMAIATPTIGQERHPVAEMFATQSCLAALATIDQDVEYTNVSGKMPGLGFMAMAFGYILGFEAAYGPLNGPAKTTLTRFRSDCLQNPNVTGAQLLEGYAADFR